MLRGCGRTTRDDGFSLIELMIALTLLGLLLALGLPAFTAMVRNTQVRTVADALQNGIRLARTEALRLNRQTVLSFTNGTPQLNATAVAKGKNWSIQTVPAASDATTPAAFIQGGALADVASGVTITSVLPNASVSALCFNANGRLSTNASPGPSGASCSSRATTFSVTQTSADRDLVVSVALGGQVRACDPKRTLSTATPDGCP